MDKVSVMKKKHNLSVSDDVSQMSFDIGSPNRTTFYSQHNHHNTDNLSFFNNNQKPGSSVNYFSNNQKGCDSNNLKYVVKSNNRNVISENLSLLSEDNKSRSCLPDKSTSFFDKKIPSTSSLSKKTCSSNQKAIVDDKMFYEPFDVGSFYNKSKGMSREGLIRLYRNVYKPDISHKFKKSLLGKVERSCSHKYFKDFSWAAYSPAHDGLFCIACTLFGHQFPSKNSRVTLLYL